MPDRAHRRRRLGRRAALLVASMVAVGLGTWWTVPQIQARQRQAQAQAALGALSQCLFGPGPDRSSARLRRTVIAAALEPQGGATWPGRCRAHALDLLLRAAELERAAQHCDGPACCPGDPRCAALTQLRTTIEQARTSLGQGRVEPTVAAQILPLAARAALEPAPAEGVVPPPTPVELHAPDDMTPLMQGDAELLTDPPGGTAFQLLFHDRRQRYRLCSLQLAEPSDARCRNVPSLVSHQTIGQLLAAEPGAPTRLLVPAPEQRDERWPQLLYDPVAGRRLLELPDRGLGGFVWRDGTIAALSTDAESGQPTVYRVRAAQSDRPVRWVPSSTASAGPELIFGALLWTEPEGESRHQLYAQQVQPQGDILGEQQRLGTTGPLGSAPSLESCQTDEGLVVLLRGEPRGYQIDVALAFRSASGWSPLRGWTVPSDYFGLTCYGSTASLSWIETVEERALDDAAAPGSPIAGVYRIHRAQCTRAGCQSGQAEISIERHGRASRYAIGDLGEAVVLLWRSPLGDVRLLRGPLEDLGRATPLSIFDDAAHGGFAWELGRGGIFARAGRAVLLSKTPEDAGSATYGFRIEATGPVVPVQVEGDD